MGTQNVGSLLCWNEEEMHAAHQSLNLQWAETVEAARFGCM